MHHRATQSAAIERIAPTHSGCQKNTDELNIHSNSANRPQFRQAVTLFYMNEASHWRFMGGDHEKNRPNAFDAAVGSPPFARAFLNPAPDNAAIGLTRVDDALAAAGAWFAQWGEQVD